MGVKYEKGQGTADGDYAAAQFSTSRCEPNTATPGRIRSTCRVHETSSEDKPTTTTIERVTNLRLTNSTSAGD
jgi:hypothetical protein